MLDRVAHLPAGLLVTVFAVLFAGFALFPAWKDSCTFDEGTHLASGYVALTRRDFRMFADNPPLAKVFAAIPLLALRPAVPTGTEPLDSMDEYAFAYKFLYQGGNDARWMLFLARLANLTWSLILLGSLYAVSRDLYGPKAGLASLALGTFCTPLLANGHLATPDASITCLFFLVVVAFVRFWDRPTWLRAGALGILLGGALAAKHSAVLLPPAMGLVMVAAWIRGKPFLEAATTGGQGLQRAALLPAVALAAFAVLWAAYGFRYAGVPEADGELSWDRFEQDSTRPVGILREQKLLPEAYLFGLRIVEHNTSQGWSTYALGLHSRTGWWWYFPFAFLVKTPLPLLAALAWAGVVAVRRRAFPAAFLLLPAGLFLGLAMTRNMNIGLRHILPIYPFLLAWAGDLGIDDLRPERLRAGRLAAAGLLIAAGLGCAWDAPHFLASFNIPSLALGERHQLLADANLDWGQDLIRLKEYMDRHGIPRVKLAYFGAASPRQAGVDHEMLPGLNVYRSYETDWPLAGPPRPGDVVAISVSNLIGMGTMDRSVYARMVSGLRPIARIGHSILVYRIPEAASPK